MSDGEVPPGTLCWFGRDWGAAVCTWQSQVFLPADTSCSMCREVIGPDQNGIRIPWLGPYLDYAYYHLACFRLLVRPLNSDVLDEPRGLSDDPKG